MADCNVPYVNVSDISWRKRLYFSFLEEACQRFARRLSTIEYTMYGFFYGRLTHSARVSSSVDIGYGSTDS